MLQTFRIRFIFLLVFLSFSVVSCQSDDKKSATKKSIDLTTSLTSLDANKQKVEPLRKFVSADNANIVKSAYLHNNLPESTFAYVRVPNIWSFIGTVKGNAFDVAMNAQPFVDAVKSIRSGFSENVIPEIPNETLQLLTKLLFKNLTSPIEVIGIEGIDPAIPTPNLVLTVSADFNAIEEIQQLLETLAQKAPEIEITKAMQADGYAELTLSNLNLQLQWDQGKSRFILLLGVGLSPNKLADFIKTIVPNSTHQMKAIENTIDSSGEGFFAWANPQKLIAIGSTLGMQREIASLAFIGVNSIKNIALGSGTSNGINRFKYVIEMPVTGFRSYLPIINTSPNFDVIGKTNMVAVLGLPSRADFVSIENTIALVSNSKNMDGYYQFKKEFRKTLGFDVEGFLDFFGQDISFVSDQAGSYVAIRLNDAEKFKTTLAESVKTLKLGYEQRVIGAHTYHHLKIPSFYAKYLENEAKNKNDSNQLDNNKVLNRLLGVPSHIYWEQEGDYLLISNIPQTLIDRHYIEIKTPVKHWLEKQQRMNPDGSLMMLSVRNEGTVEKIYRMHLNVINFLADYAGKPIDMFSLASPYEANLPKQSSYGMKITSSETQLAFELNYENNPLEFIFSGSAFQGVAVMGVLAGIAVPAYEDYKVRADLVTGMVVANRIKFELDEFEIEYGRYPNQYEIKDLKLNSESLNYSINVDENTGVINLEYNNAALRSRNTLKILPPKQGVSTAWRCKAKIKDKYLPSYCKTKK